VEAFATIEGNVLLDAGSGEDAHISIGSRAKLKWGTVIRSYDGWVEIGPRSSVGEYCVLAGHGGLSIGRAVIIAGHCHLSAAEHIFRGDVAIRFQGEESHGISIGDGCWLGAQVVVLDGVQVGAGTVVGAGSVVTRDLAAEAVAVGAPCRVVNLRTDRR